MTSTNSQSEQAYLSLLIRPERITGQNIADALGRLLAIDISTLQLQCKCDPPNIIHSLPTDRAPAALELLRNLGCDAFAPTQSDLSGLGATNKIRDINLASGGIAFEIWRTAERVVIDPNEIDVIVHAKVRESNIATPGGKSRHDIRTVTYPGGYSIDSPTDFPEGDGAALNPMRNLTLNPAERATDLDLFCKLDIHTRSGRVYQVDADKFTFDILGPRRAPTDLINIDLICDFFVELAPNAAVDGYFQLFKPPYDHFKLRIPRSKINNDNPAFAFYSRWVALMYRYLAQLPG